MRKRARLHVGQPRRDAGLPAPVGGAAGGGACNNSRVPLAVARPTAVRSPGSSQDSLLRELEKLISCENTEV